MLVWSGCTAGVLATNYSQQFTSMQHCSLHPATLQAVSIECSCRDYLSPLRTMPRPAQASLLNSVSRGMRFAKCEFEYIINFYQMQINNCDNLSALQHCIRSNLQHKQSVSSNAGSESIVQVKRPFFDLVILVYEALLRHRTVHNRPILTGGCA